MEATRQTDRPNRRHRHRAVLVSWLILTAITVGLHAATWKSGPGDMSTSADVLLTHASNISQVATLPGWMAAKISGFWLDTTRGAIVAAGLGWGMWAAVVLGLLRAGDWWAARRTAGKHERGAEGIDESRRAFFGRAAVACGVAGAAGVGAASAIGAVVNPLDLRVARYRVPIRGLPPELDGLRIVQLTDLHFGARVPESVVTQAVNKALELGADVFALTGDYIEEGDRHTARVGELLAPLVKHARIGVVGVLGNHDHYGDWRLVDGMLRRTGVSVVENGRVFVDASRRLVVEPPTRGLCLAGVQDLTEALPDMDAALQGVDGEMPRVLLAHNPDVAELCIKPRHRVDLLVCGHTHGGQVILPIVGAMFVPSAFGEKYRLGLVEGPRCPVIVSAGIGVTVMPIRIGVPPELVDLTLVRA